MQNNNTTLDAILDRFAAFDDATTMDVVLETMADVITPDTSEGWVLTDDDSFQCRRALDNNVYRLMQVVEFPNHFRIAKARIFPCDYTWKEVLDALACYGYELNTFLGLDEEHSPSFNWALVSEIIFEIESLEYLDAEFASYEEAARFISEKTGIKTPVRGKDIMSRFSEFKPNDSIEYVLERVKDLVAPLTPHPWKMINEEKFVCRKIEFETVGFLKIHERENIDLGYEYLVCYSVIPTCSYTWKDVADVMEKYGMTIDQFIKERAYTFCWEEVAQMLLESCDKTKHNIWRTCSSPQEAAAYISEHTYLPIPDRYKPKEWDDLDSPSREEETVSVVLDDEKTEALPGEKAEQRLWMFALRQHSWRSGEYIGKTVGFVRAATEADAWNKAWNEYGSGASCGLEVWDVTDKETDAYTVYRSQM